MKSISNRPSSLLNFHGDMKSSFPPEDGISNFTRESLWAFPLWNSMFSLAAEVSPKP